MALRVTLTLALSQRERELNCSLSQREREPNCSLSLWERVGVRAA